MASIKKPIYKVEAQPTGERKRRKSDLVVMWHSIWDVTSAVLQELWVTLVKTWELFEQWFISSERFQVLAWLEKHLTYAPDDFSDAWRDGRLLAILLNKLQPGCFPDAHQLDSDYGLRNVYKAFDVLEMYFGINPDVSVEEIITCSDGSDAKLFEILLELKRLSENKPECEKHIEPEADINENIAQSSVSQSCIVKGTGLAVGFVGRVSNFIIFCATMSDLDVVIEIRGTSTICSERISNRSPKKKRPILPWVNSRPITRSASCGEEHYILTTDEDSDLENRIIPLEYEVIGNQLSVSYKPKENGNHRLTIMWHGQHVSDSPYSIFVEDPTELSGSDNVVHLKSSLKFRNEPEKNQVRKISVRFQDSQVKHYEHKNNFGKVLNKRVIGYIVKINGNDVPVNAANTESLAKELLKMDYVCDNCPSFNRRNSWGFTGDAERKRSVIRQFGVDVKDLESQVSQRRSRSLSTNTSPKKLLERSDSFDSLQSGLKIVREDVLEHTEKRYDNENEEDYAFINEDLDVISVNAEDSDIKSEKVNAEDSDIRSDEVNSKASDSSSVKANANESEENLNDLTANDSAANCFECTNDEADLAEISTLSMNFSAENKVDNLYEDFTKDFSPNVANYDTGNFRKDDSQIKEVFEEHYSSRQLNHYSTVHAKLDFQEFERLKSSTDRKLKNNSNKKNSHKHIYLHPRNNSPRIIDLTINTKCFDENMPDSTEYLRKESNKNEFMLELKNTFLQNTSFSHTKKERIDYKSSNEHKVEKHCAEHSDENSDNGVTCVKRNCRNTPEASISKSVNSEGKQNTKENESFRNIEKYFEKRDDTSEASKYLTQQPESKCHLDRPSGATPKSGEMNTNELNFESSRPIKSHTLKTLVQFNFMQFNSELMNIQAATSPVKSQIEQWENSLSSENRDLSSKMVLASETGDVSVKEKLAFWESTAKIEQSSPVNSRKTSLNNKFRNSDQNYAELDLQRTTGNKSNSSEINIIEQKEPFNYENKATRNSKTMEDNKTDIELQLQPLQSKNGGRSFSDPGVFETAKNEFDDSSNSSNFQSSSKEYLYSSNDDNIESNYFDTESGSDSFHQSSEDEYIDDEITEKVEYWGDLSGVKDLRQAQCIDSGSTWEEEFLQKYFQRVKSYPERCIVFGIAAYYGHVAVKNRFQVYTGEAGFGSLSVSVQGFGRNDVTLVSVGYVRSGIYEVTYQVMTTGYYLVSIRWMDRAIPGCPLVCKVTF